MVAAFGFAESFGAGVFEVCGFAAGACGFGAGGFAAGGGDLELALACLLRDLLSSPTSLPTDAQASVR